MMGKNKGNKLPPINEETRKRMSKSHTGLKASEEACKNMSNAQKGEKNQNFGKIMSPETNEKRRQTMLGKNKGPRSEETKRKISEHTKIAMQRPDVKQHIKQR